MVNLLHLLEKEWKRIDDGARRQKKVVTYVVNLLERDYDKISKIFKTDNEEELLNELYSQIRMLSRIVEGNGIISRHGYRENPDDPSVLLGWLKVAEPDFEEIPANMRENAKKYHLASRPRDFYEVEPTDLGRTVAETYEGLFKA